jgi:hypothetical protein
VTAIGWSRTVSALPTTVAFLPERACTVDVQIVVRETSSPSQAGRLTVTTD